jgi:hypothetical protein
MLRLDSLASTQECAYAENPRPPYFFGMIIAKKPFDLRNPRPRGQVAAAVGDVEVVDHAAQFLAGAVEEGLLLGREARRRRADSSFSSRACP